MYTVIGKDCWYFPHYDGVIQDSTLKGFRKKADKLQAKLEAEGVDIEQLIKDADAQFDFTACRV